MPNYDMLSSNSCHDIPWWPLSDNNCGDGGCHSHIFTNSMGGLHTDFWSSSAHKMHWSIWNPQPGKTLDVAGGFLVGLELRLARSIHSIHSIHFTILHSSSLHWSSFMPKIGVSAICLQSAIHPHSWAVFQNNRLVQISRNDRNGKRVRSTHQKDSWDATFR